MANPSPINKSVDYPTLFGSSTQTGLAILAQSGITSAAITTINNGYYGNAGGVGQITGTFAGTATQDNTRTSIHYYHIELEQHSCIIANDVLSESYLDFNNRTTFENTEKVELPLLEPVLA